MEKMCMFFGGLFLWSSVCLAGWNTGAWGPVKQNIIYSKKISASDSTGLSLCDDSGSKCLLLNDGGDLITDRWLNSETNTILGAEAVGNDALTHSSGSDGWYNVIIGYVAGKYLTTGAFNTLIGEEAGGQATTARNLVCIGRQAGRLITTDSSTLVGTYSGKSLTTGLSNTYVGFDAGYDSTTASHNTFIGEAAGSQTTTGSHNVYIGKGCGFFEKTAVGNVFVGRNAGRYLSDGTTENNATDYSVIIGYESHPLTASDSNEIVIGNDAVGYGSNTATIGNDSISKTVLKGDVFVKGIAKKLIMQSPDGSCSECGPDNSDVWSCSSVACP